METKGINGYTFGVSSLPPLKKPTPLLHPLLSARARSNKFRQWKRQFKVIKSSIYDLASKRFVYRQVTKLIQDNQHLQVPSPHYS